MKVNKLTNKTKEFIKKNVLNNLNINNIDEIDDELMDDVLEYIALNIEAKLIEQKEEGKLIDEVLLQSAITAVNEISLIV